MKRIKFLLIYLTLFFLEVTYHIFIFKNFSFKSFFYISIFTFLTSFFIYIISSIFNNKINKIILIFSIAFCTLLVIIQFINYQFYGNIVSIYSIFNGGQVFEFFGQIFTVISSNVLPMLLFILPICLLMIFQRFITFNKINKYNVNIILFSLFYIAAILTLNLDKNKLYSAKKLYFDKHVPLQMAESLGLLTTMRIDLKRALVGFEEVVLASFEIKEEIEEDEIIEYNILDIDFDFLIQNEKNKKVNSLHNYFKNELPTKKNEYTGIFKDKNLIYIVAEAFSPIAVDEHITPTLYKLVNNGFVFNNFYTPQYYVSTSDGEYVTLTSLLPKESVWSMYRSHKINLPYSYGSVFKNLGYETYAYHNGAYRYYKRHLSHPNMGYKYTGCGNGLEKLMNCRIWPQSDLEMFNSTFDLYSENEKFMSYFMTISGHLEYNFGGNNMAFKNKKLVENLDFNNTIKAYYATQIELDLGLEALINKLEEKGILEDTVIALSADHPPYGLKNSDIKSVMHIENEKFDIAKNHFIIWNSEIEKPISVDKISHSLDTLPTILNLFGIEFDSRLLMGNDILSDHDPLVIFNDRSWITDVGKYDATKRKFYSFTSEVDKDYINQVNDIVYNKYVVSKNILESNYYNFLGELNENRKNNVK